MFFYLYQPDWGFFGSFYFVFITTSTIGFGDLVPEVQTLTFCSLLFDATERSINTVSLSVSERIHCSNVLIVLFIRSGTDFPMHWRSTGNHIDPIPSIKFYCLRNAIQYSDSNLCFLFPQNKVEVKLQDLTDKTSAILGLAPPVVGEIEEKPAEAADSHKKSE